jgi:hypothetical protein
LELIKHFFDVPHVHFVLGTNMQELQNSVSARYGAGIDAGLHLQKFFIVKIRSPAQLNGDQGTGVTERYSETISMEMGLETGLAIQFKKSPQGSTSQWFNKPNVITLRGFERLVSVLAFTLSIWHPTRFRPQFDDGLSQ